MTCSPQNAPFFGLGPVLREVLAVTMSACAEMWTGEANYPVSSQEFFDSHSRAVLDMAGGQIKLWMMPAC
jgi:hypothetical protein